MAAAVQQGTSVMVSFASFAYGAFIPEDGLTWKKPLGNIEEVTDANGAMLTKILMDQRDEFSVELIIPTTGGDVTPPIVGTLLTITNPDNVSVGCMVVDATVTFNRGNTKLSLDLIKEVSMTYS